MAECISKFRRNRSRYCENVWHEALQKPLGIIDIIIISAILFLIFFLLIAAKKWNVVRIIK